ncbi:hypothetical protein LU604_17565 [Erwinia tracheiphila]|uniref:Uncharacterized protein n=1 Tax=Erwinia tracheiphila TaxID=65700 RepID=A0A345CNT6_9GAMM|nr:hypothetical protein [Erwinia tracheiphila]AXF75103.1 hypothetical protein AV903_01615 [Erwinia tracheiphila]UIA82350.1 hypothetical protein LU604_17565 [Erwinia tracheiphila]UIA90946.1 hypothetical protein LU632_17145 [Erwinia tracheiphila]
MAKPIKNDGAQGAPELTEEKEKSVTIAPDSATGTDNVDDDDSHDPNEEGTDDDAEEDEGLLVVVCKGHTLWHNGEKYPQFQRLQMDEGDADRLLKRGVVVKYADLLKKVSDHAG